MQLKCRQSQNLPKHTKTKQMLQGYLFCFWSSDSSHFSPPRTSKKTMLIPNTQQYSPKRKHVGLSDMIKFLRSNVLLFDLAAVLSIQVGLGVLFFHQMVWYTFVVTDRDTLEFSTHTLPSSHQALPGLLRLKAFIPMARSSNIWTTAPSNLLQTPLFATCKWVEWLSPLAFYSLIKPPSPSHTSVVGSLNYFLRFTSSLHTSSYICKYLS